MVTFKRQFDNVYAYHNGIYFGSLEWFTNREPEFLIETCMTLKTTDLLAVMVRMMAMQNGAADELLPEPELT